MKFGPLQPFAGRIEFEMTSRTCKRKRSMSQRETWIARDCIAQALRRFIQQRSISGGAKPVTAYEFRISQGILAISRALLSPRMQWPVQCTRDLSGDLIFKVG